jgi:hypothetical protein
MMYFHQIQYCQIQEQIISFPRKNQRVARFPKQMFLNYIKTIFVFKMQGQKFKIHSEQIFLHQTENERNVKMVA